MTESVPPLIWDANPQGKFCVLAGLNGVERQYELAMAISRAKDFPDTACFRMDKDFRKQVALSDNLANLCRSARAAAVPCPPMAEGA